MGVSGRRSRDAVKHCADRKAIGGRLAFQCRLIPGQGRRFERGGLQKVAANVTQNLTKVGKRSSFHRWIMVASSGGSRRRVSCERTGNGYQKRAGAL